ncbi:substrate-binding domain-containing protein [Shivajiella indica]|uniref:Substrate-binding domain-containing protein n=1 Tax=Shivajiella indica TaxID=872115 RepID=A0ABW5B7F3_9BACT
MEKLRIVGVPEHFNFPWVEVVNSQPFLEEGTILEWKDEPKGSGAMNKDLREGKADLAIILTESFIKDKAEGNPARIVGWHVKSPLIWGIHISSKANEENLNQVKNSPFLISRFGSGSHLMAFLLAQREGWNKSDLKFEVIGDLGGAKQAFESSVPKIFLWEKFTTKPLVDQGLFKRIGEIPTPWPCFVIVASDEILNKNPELIKKLRDLVYQKSKTLMQNDAMLKSISKKYGLQIEDIKAWRKQTEWCTDEIIQAETLENTMAILNQLGLLSKSEITPKQLVEERLVNLQ